MAPLVREMLKYTNKYNTRCRKMGSVRDTQVEFRAWGGIQKGHTGEVALEVHLA